MCYFIISLCQTEKTHACMENRNDSHLQLSQIRLMEESGIPELEEGEEDGVAHEHPRHRGDYYWRTKPIKPIQF